MNNLKAIEKIRSIEMRAYKYLHQTGNGWTRAKAQGSIMMRFRRIWSELVNQVRGEKHAPNVSQEWKDHCEKNGVDIWYSFSDVLA